MFREIFRGPRGFLIAAVIAALILRVSFFCVSIHRVEPSTDESRRMLTAYQALHGEWPLLSLGVPYLFPLESYAIAPVLPWLPPNALGARVVPFALALLALGLAIRFLFRVTDGKPAWTSWLLLLFPSSYLLTLQSAYALPGYTIPFVLIFAGLLIAPRRENIYGWTEPLRLYAAVATMCIAMPVYGPASTIAIPAALLLLARPRRAARWFAHLIAVALGIATGFVPILLARHFTSHDAYVMGGVTQTEHGGGAWEKMWLGLKHTLPVSLGFQQCLFPDEGEIANTLIPPAVWGGLLLVLFAAATAYTLYGEFKNKRWSALTPNLALILAPLLTIVFFGYSHRPHLSSYRYFVPVVWCLPFLFNGWVGTSPERMRRGLLLITALWATWNIGAGVHQIADWNSPGLVARVAKIEPFGPAIDRLHALGIRHAYGQFGTAYRLTYMSDRSIIATEPWNSRFNWPVPFSAELRAATNIAFVLSENHSGLTPTRFNTELEQMSVDGKKEQAGAMWIYYDLHPVALAVNTAWLSDTTFTMHGVQAPRPKEATDLAESGYWLEADFHEPQDVAGIRVRFREGRHLHPMPFWVETIAADGSISEQTFYPTAFDGFQFEGGKPQYENRWRSVTLRFNGGFARQLRVTTGLDFPSQEAGVIHAFDVITHGAPGGESGSRGS